MAIRPRFAVGLANQVATGVAKTLNTASQVALRQGRRTACRAYPRKEGPARTRGVASAGRAKWTSELRPCGGVGSPLIESAVRDPQAPCAADPSGLRRDDPAMSAPSRAHRRRYFARVRGPRQGRVAAEGIRQSGRRSPGRFAMRAPSTTVSPGRCRRMRKEVFG